MHITLHYFASIREALGHSSAPWQTQASTLAELRDELIRSSPAHAACLARGQPLRMALNQVLSQESAPLQAGDDVAFFPPVTGG